MIRDKLQPRNRTARKILRIHEINRQLRDNRRNHETNEAHVMIKRQPAGRAVILFNAQAIFRNTMTVRTDRRLRTNNAFRR